jgi:hypothetical protein
MMNRMFGELFAALTGAANAKNSDPTNAPQVFAVLALVWCLRSS